MKQQKLCQMTLTNDQVDLIRKGVLTRLAIRAHPGDYYEPTDPTSGRLMTSANTVRFTTDEIIHVHTPLQKNVMQIKMTGVSGASAMARYVFDITPSELHFYGHTRMCDLWMEWVERYDPAAAWWWRGVEPLIDLEHRDKIFRKFLKTRPKEQYLAWVLMLSPIGETIKESA